MTDSTTRWAVALDGGTTNTRARLIDVATGSVVATARRAVGVRDTVLAGRGLRPVEEAVRGVLEEVGRAAEGSRPGPIVAAGMLSAEVGLMAVPHVLAPAGLDELARGAVAVSFPSIGDRPIVVIPGIRTPAGPGPDGWAEADVMRGEECETLGAWMSLALASSPVPSPGPAPAPGPDAPHTAFLWPGSHTKLVAVDGRGRIIRSYTTLAGELLHALARHTLLATSLPEEVPDDPDPAAVEAGARLVEREGLGRAAFLVRIAALTGSLGSEERAAFWVGAVVAEDVARLTRHPILQADPRPDVWVGGRRPLRGLYAGFLARRHDGRVRELEERLAESASALGALAVAARRSEAREVGRDDGVTG
jgi:2-dehydro-3-deoxygalactonokinase